MSPYLVFALAGLATYLLRSALVMAGGVLRSGGWFEQRIAYVGPAVMAALIASSLFVSATGPTLGSAAEIAAVGAALFAVMKTEKVALALAVGLPVYWVAVAIGFG